MPTTATNAIEWPRFKRLHSWAAIDFETANAKRASVCAVGIVRVDHGKITGRLYQVIRPEELDVTLTWIHGLTEKDLEHARTFRELWPCIRSFLKGCKALAAHNPGFDRTAMAAACRAASLPMPKLPWMDTITLARQKWQIHPTGLDRVCSHLGIHLDHHNAASDAEAVARIVLEAKKR